MPRAVLILVAAGAVGCTMLSMSSVRESSALVTGEQIRVLVVHNPRHDEAAARILPAYASVLAEEGVPHGTIAMFDLLDVDPAAAPSSTPALILPDKLCATGLTGVARWLAQYVEAGGRLLLVHDAGSRNDKGAFQHTASLLEVAGIAPEADDPSGASRFFGGRLRLADPAAAAALQVPPGKLDQDLVLCGYGFGTLAYPLASAAFLAGAGSEPPRVLAFGLDDAGQARPVIFARRRGDGELLYAGLPLGYLKSRGDDLPLRLVLRHFLFDMARVPHLMPTPGGRGGVVVNWHVDSRLDWSGIPALEEAGLLRAELPFSFHVCAGPDLEREGDGLGFDAAGAGAAVLASLRPYGEIGSHGGWRHNWFAGEQNHGRLGPADVARHIRRNRDALATPGRPVREYSAPAGVHPQPVTTRILEDLGFVAYYFTGDSGSAPNRSFHDGAMVSDRVVAFPILTLGPVASVGEMLFSPAATPERAAAWLTDVADYCERERTVRVVYSHPYDLSLAPGAGTYRALWRAWIDDLAARQAAGRLEVRPMSYYADFLLRMVATGAQFVRDGDRLRVRLDGAELDDLAVAVPHGAYRLEETAGVRVERDGAYDLYVLSGSATTREFALALGAQKGSPPSATAGSGIVGGSLTGTAP